MKLTYDEQLSSFAFNFNLRRYNKDLLESAKGGAVTNTRSAGTPTTPESGGGGGGGGGVRDDNSGVYAGYGRAPRRMLRRKDQLNAKRISRIAARAFNEAANKEMELHDVGSKDESGGTLLSTPSPTRLQQTLLTVIARQHDDNRRVGSEGWVGEPLLDHRRDETAGSEDAFNSSGTKTREELSRTLDEDDADDVFMEVDPTEAAADGVTSERGDEEAEPFTEMGESQL